MGTPTITATATGNGVLVSVTNLAAAATGASGFELWRTTTERYWQGAYARGTEGSGQLARLAVSATTNDTFTDVSPESGTSYGYFVRAIGDTMATADSATITVTDFRLEPGVYLVAAADAVLIGAAVDTTEVFRIPPPGQSVEFVTESATHLFAGRRYPVVEFGIHDLSQLGVTVHVPYSDGANGYGTEMDLLAWERSKTTLLYRDARGVKAYGVIVGLTFTNTQWGREAEFTLQPVDYDASVAA